MEIIKNYLESMFANLPNTPDVLRAKSELLSMMEDKYSELISEGKTENEAIGIVISEFGNLDELADSLGIANAIKVVETNERRQVTMTESREYVYESMRHYFIVGLSVLLFIVSPVGTILCSGFHSDFLEAIAVVALLLLVAVGVGLIVFSSQCMRKWEFLDKVPCTLDFATSDELYREKQEFATQRAVQLAVGILFCVISIVPVIILSSLTSSFFLLDVIGPSALLVLVGIGVMKIIACNGRNAAIEKLLGLNDKETVSGNYESTVSGRGANIESPKVKSFMQVYWKTVSSIYLIWSFLTFDWHITWIIWPIAAVIKSFIMTIIGQGGNENE